MSNVNSFEAFYNLPTASVTVNTATPLTVQPSGVYAGLPSPLLPVGSFISLGITDVVAGNMTVDGHPFKVRVSGKFNTGAASTFTPAIFLGTPTAVATSVASLASAAVTGASNFTIEATFIWDSVSQSLDGFFYQSVNGAVPVLTVTTKTAVTSAAGLSFVPQFTFGTANAANTVTVTEFVIDRV